MSTLNAEQNMAYERFLQGASIFITGPAGCGKSFLINQIRRYCQEHDVPHGVTALTGAAAHLIGGQTLHAWGGLGMATEPASTLISKITRRTAVCKRWRECRVLIIDEVSMMSAELFNKLHLIATGLRSARAGPAGSGALFGGLQIVLCGDFAQLEPIGAEKFCFESKLWASIETFYLPKIIRQADPEFQSILMQIRLGQVTPQIKQALNARLICDEAEADITLEDENGNPAGVIKGTMLYPLRRDVDRINTDELDKLVSNGAATKEFIAVDNARHRHTGAVVSMTRNYVEVLNKRLTTLESLTLAVGAQVMLLKNMDVDSGLVNGSRGVVTGFDGTGHPTIAFDNGEQLHINPASFEVEVDGLILVRKQIPLMLAWAMTIHKCQGATISHVITDLSDIFGNAQAYVTLSRVRSLEGLHIIGINYRKITCHPKVREYYRKLEASLIDHPPQPAEAS